MIYPVFALHFTQVQCDNSFLTILAIFQKRSGILVTYVTYTSSFITSCDVLSRKIPNS